MDYYSDKSSDESNDYGYEYDGVSSTSSGDEEASVESYVHVDDLPWMPPLGPFRSFTIMNNINGDLDVDHVWSWFNLGAVELFDCCRALIKNAKSQDRKKIEAELKEKIGILFQYLELMISRLGHIPMSCKRVKMETSTTLTYLLALCDKQSFLSKKALKTFNRDLVRLQKTASSLLNPAESSSMSDSPTTNTSRSSSDKPATPPEDLESSLPSNADVDASSSNLFDARRLAAVEEKRVTDSQLPPVSSNASLVVSKVGEEDVNEETEGEEVKEASSVSSAAKSDARGEGPLPPP